MTAATNTGAWKPGQSGNPFGRKSGAEKLRALLEPHREDLVAKAVSMALAGDPTALRIVIDRLAPPSRAEAPPVEIPGLADANTLTKKAGLLIDAIGAGLLAPDTGSQLLNALAAACKVAELDELAQRVAALEARDPLA